MKDFIDAKDNKDLKYITKDWKVTDNSGVLYGVQGDTSNNNYFTQSQRYQAWKDNKWAVDDKIANDPIGWSADKYSDWEEFHKSSVVWFDTAGCFDTNNFFTSDLYGHINNVNFDRSGGWYKGVEYYQNTGDPTGATDQSGAITNDYPT